jgi:hypothetical protein
VDVGGAGFRDLLDDLGTVGGTASSRDRAGRLACNDAEIRLDLPGRARFALLPDPLEEQLDRDLGDFIATGVDTRHGGDREPRLVDIVESDDRDLLRDADPLLAEGSEHAEAERVVECEDRVERNSLLEHAASGDRSALAVPWLGDADELVGLGEPGGGESLPVSL